MPYGRRRECKRAGKTLVDQWARLGLHHAVVAPGSRSTPMALALAARDDLAVHVVHDERSAAFIALGIGLALWGAEPQASVDQLMAAGQLAGERIYSILR